MFLALAHMVGATQVMGLGWGGVGMITFFELAHVVGATQVMGWGGVGVGWGGDDNVLWTCTHGRCYASHGMGWGGVGMITFFELAHMVGATQVMGWGGVGVGWGGDDNVLWTCTHGRCYASHGMGWGGVGMITFFELAHMVGAVMCWWKIKYFSPQKMKWYTLELWPTALLNTWNIITFPKSSFYHTNHTFLTNINVWMMDFSSINTRIKKISSAQNTILCREWLLQKLTFRHSEITIFNHSHNPTQRTFGEPQAPSVYIYIYISCLPKASKNIPLKFLN